MTPEERAEEFVYDWLRQDCDSLSCSRTLFTEALASTIRDAVAEETEACAEVAKQCRANGSVVAAIRSRLEEEAVN